MIAMKHGWQTYDFVVIDNNQMSGHSGLTF